jgi:LysM repeat protein
MKKAFLKLVLLLVFVLPFDVQAQTTNTYTVKPGDTLYSIARLYNISVEDLSRLNNLETGVIRSGMVLIVAEAEAEAEAESETEAPPEVLPAPKPLDLQPKDPSEGGMAVRAEGDATLESVADQLGLATEELLMLNPAIESVIERMNQISPEVEITTLTYIVKAGDTLYGVAKNHGLSVSQLSDLNGLKQTGLRTGQKLKVPGDQPAGSSTWSSTGILNAVVYPSTLSDRMLMGGLRYAEDIFVVGHPTLPLGTLIMLGTAQQGPSVLCIVADAGLSISSDVVDVSAVVADAVRLSENERVEVYTLK